MYTVTAFYKYVEMTNPESFRDEFLAFCLDNNIKGRVLMGREGINGVVCALPENIKTFQNWLNANPLFSDMEFKDQESIKVSYPKMHVRVRDKIVNFVDDVDLKNTAPFLTPKEVHDLVEKNPNVVFVDMRNDYEAKIGRFKNARITTMSQFRDLPKVMNELEDLKDKTVITYCTGGIRCEKASAYLKQNGFKNVYQIKGGILKYGEEYPDQLWEGKCFVFDERISVPLNKNDQSNLDLCEFCGKKGSYVNCHNKRCDKLFISCESCAIERNASCSEDCQKAEHRRNKNSIVGEDIYVIN